MRTIFRFALTALTAALTREARVNRVGMKSKLPLGAFFAPAMWLDAVGAWRNRIGAAAGPPGLGSILITGERLAEACNEGHRHR